MTGVQTCALPIRAGYRGMKSVPHLSNPAKIIQVPVFNIPPKQIARLFIGLDTNFFQQAPTTAHKKNTLVHLQSEKFIKAPAQKISVGISLLKNVTRLEWLLEKATEMGIYEIKPLICEHTIFEKFKLERFQNIVQSAMIQSQQVWLPLLATPVKFKEALQSSKEAQKLIAHCAPTHKLSIKKIEAASELEIGRAHV